MAKIINWLKTLNELIVEFRLIRRTLVFIFCYLFWKVTNGIFITGDICVNPSVNIAYGTFSGLILFILKFYFYGKKDDADND